MSCYTYKEYDLGQGSLDPSVDCTYVMVMEDSSRIEQIYEQVLAAGLTGKVIFQVNKGYKKCHKKGLQALKPNYDLVDANKAAFQHALNRGFKRILLLEDDCEFDSRVHDPEIIDDLNIFLVRKDPCIYNLGPVFGFCSPLDVLARRKHQLMLYTTHNHAVIFNDVCMKRLLERNYIWGHTDVELNRHLSKYTYHKPLAYQKIDLNTENMRHGWGSGWRRFADVVLVKPTGVDKNVQPGFDRFKNTCDILSVLIFLIIVIKVTTHFINRK